MSLIQIGQPLYEWKTRQGLILVTQSGQLISQNISRKTVTSVNIYNKLSYTFSFNQAQCKHLDISPCENYLAYWHEIEKKFFVGVTDAPAGGDRLINLSSRLSVNSQIIQLFWIRNTKSEEPLLLLVTNNALELFSLGVDMTTRTLRRISITCIYCWVNNIADYVLLLTNNTGSSVMLKPYRIVERVIESLDPIEIEIPGTDLIQQDDIELLLIYGKVYCVHKYVKGGIISLRPLGVKSQDPDIVLSVNGTGKVEICLIDNLLILIDSHLMATVYDIGFNDESLQRIFTSHIKVPWLRLNESDSLDEKSDCNTNCSQEFEFELEGISFHLPAIFISLDEGTARPVEINWAKVEKYMECEFTPSSYINFYQRRLCRKQEMINLLHKLINNDYDITELFKIFTIITNAYKSAVQSVRQSFSKDSSCKYIDGVKLWSVPADVINKFIGDSSILTENDIINLLFYKILNIDCNTDSSLNASFSREKLTLNANNSLNSNNSLNATLNSNSLNAFSTLGTSLNATLDASNEQKKSSDEPINVEEKNEIKAIKQASNVEKASNVGAKVSNFEKVIKEKKKSSNEAFYKGKRANKKPSDDFSTREAESNEKEAFNEKATNEKKASNVDKKATSERADGEIDRFNAERVFIPLLCYLKSLISVSVAPSPCLNVLLFDICVILDKFTTLRNFLSSGVILPSRLVRNRINGLESDYPDQKWIKQIRLDMDITMKNWNSVVKSLIGDKEYLLALDLLCNNKVDTYPIYEILNAAATDVESQENNPRMWCNLLNKVIKWSKTENKPNLQKCSMWLPMLKDNQIDNK